MKIEGVITVEGVDLHVDVEASDEARHLYITNVAPNTLILPPERLRLEWLALSPKTLTALIEQQRENLADIVDQQGNLTVKDLPPKAQKEVEQALAHLKQAALVFDWKLHTAAVRNIPIEGDLPRTLPGSPAMGAARSPQQYSKAELLKRHVNEIEVLCDPQRRSLATRAVNTIGDLLTLGEDELVMIPGFDVDKIEQIKTWLAAKGVSFNGLVEVEPGQASEQTAGSNMREFLKAQGLHVAVPEGAID